MACSFGEETEAQAEKVPAIIAELESKYNQLADGRKYDAIIASSLDAIKSLFEKLDLDADSTLDKSELKEIVAKYNGEAFDEEKFFGWFDVHGAGRGPERRRSRGRWRLCAAVQACLGWRQHRSRRRRE